MKKRDKGLIFVVMGMVSSLIMLVSGAHAMELEEVGIAIILLMCSLYLAMSVHAVMIAMSINRRFEDKKEETYDGSS